MIFHHKSIWCGAILVQGAAWELKGAVARTAVKVVVMPRSGSFIQRPDRWMADPFKPPVSDKNFQVPIDRCLVEGWHDIAAVCENLIDGQWPLVLPKNLLYGHFLGCIAPQK